MRLHDYAASGNCYKVRLLLSLLGRPYERVPVDLFAGETLTRDFALLNPVRETPVLELQDGTVLTQSPAILWYLAEDTSFLPGQALDRAQVLQWLAFEQERIMTGIGGARFRLLTGRATAKDPLMASRLELGREALNVLDTRLSEHKWLVADRATIADIAAFAYVSRSEDVDLKLPSSWPAVSAWVQRVRGLPAFLDDFEDYPPNARAGAGPSIYD
ncbi:MAG TPA: glutathione S-transferase family protein [Solirubrobacteraceae bacterium]|nr:glutathione S-transferase family protein [Solirubrobacteraceae bacterium]